MVERLNRGNYVFIRLDRFCPTLSSTLWRKSTDYANNLRHQTQPPFASRLQSRFTLHVSRVPPHPHRLNRPARLRRPLALLFPPGLGVCFVKSLTRPHLPNLAKPKDEHDEDDEDDLAGVRLRRGVRRDK